MSAKIRFYLEQSVPELEELHEKGIFTRPEITQIIKRRTDFEHKINSPSGKPQDYIRYAEYETSLDKLRTLRAKRIFNANDDGEVPTIGEYGGTRRILFIYERATRKFSGNIDLWVKYLEYAKQVHANQVINKLFSKMLKLHSSKPELWILAAKHEVEYNGAMSAARNILQRCLRLNSESQILWTEYAKLELAYVAKILARRKLLGLKDSVNATDPETEREQTKSKEVESNADMIVLPQTSTEEIDGALKSLPDADMSMLGNPTANPALRGDIALAIFDAAMQKFSSASERKQMELATTMLDIVDKFDSLNRQYLCQHIIDFADTRFSSPDTLVLKVTLPVRHTDYMSAQFPDQLRVMLQNLASAPSKLSQSAEFKSKLKQFIYDKYLAKENLEQNLRTVLTSISDSLN